MTPGFPSAYPPAPVQPVPGHPSRPEVPCAPSLEYQLPKLLRHALDGRALDCARHGRGRDRRRRHRVEPARRGGADPRRGAAGAGVPRSRGPGAGGERRFRGGARSSRCLAHRPEDAPAVAAVGMDRRGAASLRDDARGPLRRQPEDRRGPCPEGGGPCRAASPGDVEHRPPHAPGRRWDDGAGERRGWHAPGR